MYSTSKGFIKIILIVLVALIAARLFFGFDIIAFLESDTFVGILQTIWDIIKTVWNDYIFGTIDKLLKR